MRELSMFLFAAFVAVGVGCSGNQDDHALGALPDTQENREAQARRYLEVVPPREMLDDIVKNMAAAMPEKRGAEFANVLTEHIDMVAFENLLLTAMTKVFTAEELRALADFYGSPVGRSAMDKFGEYMAEAMPSIRELVGKAMQKAKETGG
jgi:hypothetical protein